MKRLVLLTMVVLSTVFLTACTDKLYEVEGIVAKIDCDLNENSKRFDESSVTLDNGVTYHRFDELGCSFSEGVEVKIVHNGSLNIHSILVKGTKEIGDTN